ncbi:MAG: hypothetical protein CSA55_06080 [Ilumatobacter coccineus]|uniref:NADH-quinone oxidoreductase subunit J n=1 Tax=Ilumatobacter coccineus TaxID=467094 RepID=A0A2G6K6G5_9ACTN|nr:MAG: hypothetical protein CSA55_06080 [Ilumatobacter coccineus]
MMNLIIFILATAMVLVGGLGVVLRHNPVHAALSLVLTLFGIAVHFVSLEAHFLAAVQVIVYAGAIVVLFLFVIMLLGVDEAEDLTVEPFPVQRPLAIIVGIGTAVLLVAAVLRGQSTLAAVSGAEQPAEQNLTAIAHTLFSDYVFAFEFTSILLIVVVTGTVLLTRREKGGSR